MRCVPSQRSRYRMCGLHSSSTPVIAFYSILAMLERYTTLATAQGRTRHQLLLLVWKPEIDAKWWIDISCRPLALVDLVQCLDFRTIELEDLHVLLNARQRDRLRQHNMPFAHCSTSATMQSSFNTAIRFTLITQQDGSRPDTVFLRNVLHNILLKKWTSGAT